MQWRIRRNIGIVSVLFLGLGVLIFSQQQEPQAILSTGVSELPDSLAYSDDTEQPLTSSEQSDLSNPTTSTSLTGKNGEIASSQSLTTLDADNQDEGKDKGEEAIRADALFSSVEEDNSEAPTKSNGSSTESSSARGKSATSSRLFTPFSSIRDAKNSDTADEESPETSADLPRSSVSSEQSTPSTTAATVHQHTADHDDSADTSSISKNKVPATTGTPTSSTAKPTSTTAHEHTNHDSEGSIDSYEKNLAMIRAQSFRNTNHDQSPYRDTPQAALDISDQSPFLGPRAAYLQSPNGNPEQSFPTVAGGQFRTSCEFSHFSYDDPLLYPNQPGKAHLHMFFGNTDVNAFSTFEKLRDSGSSTCNGQELNRTGYWAPAIIDGSGNARIPERVVVYYKGEGMANGSQRPAGGAQLYKPGMANISPNPTSVAEVDSGSGGAIGEVNYKCSNNSSAYPYATGVNKIPNCSGDYWADTYGAPYPATRTVLEMEVKFWNCFPTNGNTSDWKLWSPAGASRGGWYFSNCDGSGGGNPADMEIYPNLVYYINYVVEPGEDTSDWFLSSDVDPATVTGTPALAGSAGEAHHSDWWGGWHPTINQEWLDNCVNFSTSSGASGCGFGYLSNGGPSNQSPYSGRALKYRPQYDKVGDSSTYKIPLESLFKELCEPLHPAHKFGSPGSGAYCVPSSDHHH